MESQPKTAISSDHILVTGDIRVKLKNKAPLKQNGAKKYHKPDPETQRAYNDRIRQIFQMINVEEGLHMNNEMFVKAMTDSAEKELQEIHPLQNRDYISANTWDLIEKRQTARENENQEEEDTLNKDIKKSARQDKLKWRTNKLEDLTDLRSSWKNIKFEKQNFTPNYYSMKDIRGNRVPITKKAEAISEYLFEKQWAPVEHPPEIDPNRAKVITQDLHINTGEFKKLEVEKAIKQLKQHKAPGPDEATTELFKWLDSENLDTLTHILNELWIKKQVPATFTQANVASIYKKGDHDNPENYRPISLLNTTYKIYCIILHHRISNKIDTHLGETQFGFRRKNPQQNHCTVSEDYKISLNKVKNH